MNGFWSVVFSVNLSVRANVGFIIQSDLHIPLGGRGSIGQRYLSPVVCSVSVTNRMELFNTASLSIAICGNSPSSGVHNAGTSTTGPYKLRMDFFNRAHYYCVTK
jgi:hypothetical protein